MARLLWQTSSDGGTTYTPQLTPSTYKIDWEDLDADSYRAITTGNLIRNIVSKKWTKISMTYNLVSPSQLNTLLGIINAYPIYVIAENQFFSGGSITAQFYCSKVNAEMLETGDYNLSFNLIQITKVSGQ